MSCPVSYNIFTDSPNQILIHKIQTNSTFCQLWLWVKQNGGDYVFKSQFTWVTFSYFSWTRPHLQLQTTPLVECIITSFGLCNLFSCYPIHFMTTSPLCDLTLSSWKNPFESIRCRLDSCSPWLDLQFLTTACVLLFLSCLLEALSERHSNRVKKILCKESNGLGGIMRCWDKMSRNSIAAHSNSRSNAFNSTHMCAISRRILPLLSLHFIPHSSLPLSLFLSWIERV
jgi:hypothetical protein